MKIRVAHSSQQHNDPPPQHKHDAVALFERAVERDYIWITGTEAGQRPFAQLLRGTAKDHGYTFAEYKSLWVCVQKKFIEKGTYKHNAETVTDNANIRGRGHDPSLLWAQFVNQDLGPMTVMAGHLPRFGRPDAHNREYRANLKWNEKVAQAVGNHADELGAHKALFFYGGDQNIPDSISDTFLGAPMTSAGDEVGHTPNTGHGPIDVIASYDGDGRVSAVSFKAFNDKKFFLYTDHYLTEAVFDIRELSN